MFLLIPGVIFSLHDFISFTLVVAFVMVLKIAALGPFVSITWDIRYLMEEKAHHGYYLHHFQSSPKLHHPTHSDDYLCCIEWYQLETHKPGWETGDQVFDRGTTGDPI
jgi:hypothetical protein